MRKTNTMTVRIHIVVVVVDVCEITRESAATAVGILSCIFYWHRYMYTHDRVCLTNRKSFATDQNQYVSFYNVTHTPAVLFPRHSNPRFSVTYKRQTPRRNQCEHFYFHFAPSPEFSCTAIACKTARQRKTIYIYIHIFTWKTAVLF